MSLRANKPPQLPPKLVYAIQRGHSQNQILAESEHRQPRSQMHKSVELAYGQTSKTQSIESLVLSSVDQMHERAQQDYNLN